MTFVLFCSECDFLAGWRGGRGGFCFSSGEERCFSWDG